MRTKAYKTSTSVVAVALLAALVAACGPQKHENQAHDNQAHENYARGGRHGIRAVCAADIQKYCAQADRPRRCLRDNIDKLSDGCKSALAAQRRNRDGNRDDNQQQQQ